MYCRIASSLCTFTSHSHMSRERERCFFFSMKRSILTSTMDVMWGTQQPFNLFEVKLSFTKPPSGSISPTGQPCQLNNMFILFVHFLFGRRVHVYRLYKKTTCTWPSKKTTAWRRFLLLTGVSTAYSIASSSFESLGRWEPEKDHFAFENSWLGSWKISFPFGGDGSMYFFRGYVRFWDISLVQRGNLLLRATQLGNFRRIILEHPQTLGIPKIVIQKLVF